MFIILKKASDALRSPSSAYFFSHRVKSEVFGVGGWRGDVYLYVCVG